MKLISWNVNGIRAVLKKGFLDYIKSEQADIICLQETKAHPDQVDLLLDEYPHHYWNSAQKKGYSGVAVFSKIEPLSTVYGLAIEKHDTEGRVITLEYESFYLINVYTPNSKRGLERLTYRQKEWDVDFLTYAKSLEKTKPVVICGDLNVAHQEIDLKNPQSNKRSAGFTDEEREGMTNVLAAGFIDTFRHLYPDTIKYTWWSYMFQARQKGIGWRIDYFLISQALEPYLVDAYIRDDVFGSDHCPVGIILKIDKA
ncbi:MAG: exodeoxyribonuclease III [Candidatus Woesearchaeota archaeon]